MRTVHDEDDSGDDIDVDDDVDDVDDDVEDEVDDDGENDGEDDGDGDDEDDDNEEAGDDEDDKTIWDKYKEGAAGATENVEEATLPEVRKYVIKRYINDVVYYNKFRRDSAHKQITATKRKFLDDADEDEQLGDYEALKLAVAKRQHLIDEVSGLESDDEKKEGDEENDA
jgi:hypothetical protein